MSTKEIITLQFGHYPNFVGAHWWNIQETGFQYSSETPSEINHDVLYREGLTSNHHVTFTPRLLLSDLKGSLKTLTKYGDLYEPIVKPCVSSISWDSDQVEVINEEKLDKNEFQEALSQETPLDKVKSKHLDDTIEVWSDFLYTRFHPRTTNIINEYNHNSTDNTFDVYPLGRDLWNKTDYSEEFSDKIRSYIEECDNLQGFHMLLDVTNAFGGLSASCLEHIKDEYDKKSVLSIPIIPSYYSDYNIMNSEDREKSTLKDSIRLVNLLLSLDSVSENSCLTIPLCTGSKGWRQPGPKRIFKHLNYEQESIYHTSAVLATALDTITMPYRIKSNRGFTIGDFCSDLNTSGRKIASASLGLPFGIKDREYLIDCLDKWEGPLWESLTPNCKIDSDKSLQHVTIRGIPMSKLKKLPHLAEKQREMPAYRCETVKEMIEYYISCTQFYTSSHVTALDTALTIKVPYPDIFDEFVDVHGNIIKNSRLPEQRVKSVPLIAGCHSGAGVGEMLETLHRESGRIKLGKFHQFTSNGLEDDEYKECLHRILDLRDCYEESFD